VECCFMLKPLGSRLLVKPDPPATEIGGILVPPSSDKPPAMTGTVIALGRGPASAHRVRQETLGEVREAFEAIGFTSLAEAALRRLAQIDLHDVAEGDCVCFAFTSGTNLTIDGETFILIAEDDLEAVWTPDVAGVA
jgi:co-chaperonin GroES (HSP10)